MLTRVSEALDSELFRRGYEQLAPQLGAHIAVLADLHPKTAGYWAGPHQISPALFIRHNGHMLKLAILGFLRDHPLHGYDLKSRIAALTGHVKPIADGTLYPAIKRLENAGLLTRRSAPGKIAAPRHMLQLTQDGIDYLKKLLREPADEFITDDNRWFVLLAFLRHLENPREQAIVLHRRLDFLQDPVPYFYDAAGRPAAVDDFDDVFRQGLLRVAHARFDTEFAWLNTTIGQLERH